MSASTTEPEAVAGGRPKERAGQFLVDYLNLVFGRYMGMLVGVVRGVMVPRLLDPAMYGIYKSLLIIPTYVRAGHLGAVSGLSRQIPFYRGRGDETSLTAAVRVAYTFSLGSALLSCAILVAYSLTLADHRARVGLWIFLVFVVTGQQTKLQETYLLGHQRFVAVSRLNLAQNIYSTVLAIAGAWLFGLMGVIVATAIDGVVTLFLFRWVSGIGFPGFSLDRRVIRDLLSVGSPLLLTGLLGNVLFTVDRFVILKFLGTTAVGYYSLAAAFVVYVNDLSNLLSRVVFPKIVMSFGAGESLDRLKRFVHYPITATSYTFPLLVIWIHYFCVWGFRLVYPKYLPGAAVMEILTFSILPYSHYLSYMNLVVAMKRQMGILWMYALAILVTTGIALGAVWVGAGITGVALGAVAGMFVISIVLYFHSEKRLLETEHRWPRFWRSYGPTFWVAAIVTGDWFIGRGTSVTVRSSLIRAGVVTLLYLPAVVLAWRWDEEFRSLVATARRVSRLRPSDPSGDV
ncbi:MAG TPA: oligosaccharide flippase family protein [Candidatus Polarisedimenticolaceae bacterium]|nr:oligosaccharide flippase family protein [Candidatus Polarisedimenticolaceae bacterium]